MLLSRARVLRARCLHSTPQARDGVRQAREGRRARRVGLPPMRGRAAAGGESEGLGFAQHIPSLGSPHQVCAWSETFRGGEAA